MVACLAAAGCGNDAPATTAAGVATTPAAEPAARAGSSVVSESSVAMGPDAEAAQVICSALKDEANAMTRVANAAVREIYSLSAEERVDAILGGFDAAAEQVTAFQTTIAELELPPIEESGAIADEIAAGATAALDELADERARFSDDVGTSIDDDDVWGRVGQFFNSIEKVDSLVEPVIGRYERRDLRQAFLDTDDCQHVIQPFRIDE